MPFLCALCVLCGSLPVPSFALEVFLVRHGETVGNVTGDYSDINQRTFSPKGLQQIQDLVGKLENLSFDAILVSPAWRTQQTILPYLQQAGLQAEICPEIEEGDCGISGDETPSANPPTGMHVDIVPEGITRFRFREGSPGNHFAPRSREDGLAILQRARKLILDRFGGKDQRILLVSHGCTGGRLIELLLGLKARGTFGPANAAVTRLVQKEDGSFEITQFNDAPVTPLQRACFMGFSEEILPGFVNLEGAWRIASGDDEARAVPEFDDSSFSTSSVPGGWERDALPDYDGIAWYRVRFAVPEERQAAWSNKPLALIMGAIDDADQTWLNGTKIGESGVFSPVKQTAWDQPRIYELPPGLLSTQNLLAIRVDDWGGGGGLWRGPAALGPVEVLRSLQQKP